MVFNTIGSVVLLAAIGVKGSGCTDLKVNGNAWVDKYGDDCDWWRFTSEWCFGDVTLPLDEFKNYAKDGVSADEVCCGCGGGSTKLLYEVLPIGCQYMDSYEPDPYSCKTGKGDEVYTCVSGQGGFGENDRGMSLEQLREKYERTWNGRFPERDYKNFCAVECNKDSNCVAFDYRTNSERSDMCRIYHTTANARDDGGIHNRRRCTKHLGATKLGATTEWKLVVRQTMPYTWKAGELSLNPTDPSNDNYAILDQLESYRTNGRFTFKLVWPEDAAGIPYEWIQTSNPVSEKVTGYVPLYEPYYGQHWGGLEPSGHGLMDGSVGHGNWFYAVGANKHWQGGYPSYAKSESDAQYPQQKVELYVLESKSPTESPTVAPTPAPTEIPTKMPTEKPTPQPTTSPTIAPTKNPSKVPTAMPTRQPSAKPTRQPSAMPTRQPSAMPTRQPSAMPTRQPSAKPTLKPTPMPIQSSDLKPTEKPVSPCEMQKRRKFCEAVGGLEAEFGGCVWRDRACHPAPEISEDPCVTEGVRWKGKVLKAVRAESARECHKACTATRVNNEGKARKQCKGWSFNPSHPNFKNCFLYRKLKDTRRKINFVSGDLTCVPVKMSDTI